MDDSGDKNKRIFGRSAVRLFVRENGKEGKLRHREMSSATVIDKV